MSTESYLDRYLEPVTQAFSPTVAQSIVELEPSADVTARVEELGRKNNDGSITDEEKAEYKSLADVGTMISLLKAKARRFLAQ